MNLIIFSRSKIKTEFDKISDNITDPFKGYNVKHMIIPTFEKTKVECIYPSIVSDAIDSHHEKINKIINYFDSNGKN